ncbi:MAG: ThuA domain-containing protein [Verrucomicrobiota bacterium]
MKKLGKHIVAFLLISVCTLVGATPDEKISVLIVDGFSNHDWKATTQAISSILRSDENFEIDVSTVPTKNSELWKAWNPDFNDYDLVIQNTNDISRKGSWPEAAKKSLERYVSGGGGLLIFHSANNAFPNWDEYNQMIGLGWRKKGYGRAIVIREDKPVIIPTGEGGNTGHGKRVNAVITRLGDHPIHKGLPKKWMAADTEIYRYARGPAENISILSYANDAKTGLNFPTEWVVGYGEGRVYNSTFGHYWRDLSEAPPGIRCNGFRTVLCRAARWLARAEITPTSPDNFPSADRISLHEGN